MASRNWHDLSYLQKGTDRQQAADAAIRQAQVMMSLATYQPVLAGTIPLDIDVPGSDLDILCYAPDLATFAADVRRHYGHISEFSAADKVIKGQPAHIARFTTYGFDFELFAQAIPVEQQHGYVHMLIEARLLDLFPEAREAIRALKRDGLKTEPAFGQYFGIMGDPYAALLDLAALDDETLLRRFAR
ncbi:MAG: HIT family protein [Anaerolineaceae bacterium]|nr:HIT family protein [Anaerolineaceae bacterium]